MNSTTYVIPPPPLLPEREMSPLLFIVLGLLRPGLKSFRDLLEILVRDFKYNPGERNTSLITALIRFEEMGLIVSTPVDSEKVYRLSQQGEERWNREFEHRRVLIEFWSPFYEIKAPPSRPRPKGVVTQSKPKLERAPTPEERDTMLKASYPAFRRVLQFIYSTNVRATDLIFARIENLRMDEGILMLEETTYTGKPIKNREIRFGDELRPVLREAIGKRKRGPIFLSKRGVAWQPNHLSAVFRRTKQKAGVPDEVHVSGRGGKIGAILAKERPVTRWTEKLDKIAEAEGKAVSNE